MQRFALLRATRGLLPLATVGPLICIKDVGMGWATIHQFSFGKEKMA